MTISVPADVLSRLKAVLGEGGWSQDPDRLAPKLLEWRDRWTGSTPFLALPKTTADVGEGYSHVGSTNAFSLTLRGRKVTAVGEVPRQTVRTIASSLVAE